MIPRSYPTLIDGRKAGYMRVFFLTSVSGLTKWIDYIPVKTVAFSATAEGTTNANGHINVAQVSSSTALRKWVDYIPVFEDGSATVPWSTNANGYIPVNQMLDLDFRSGILDSRITFTRADASTCATYFDSTGRMQTATANTPRFDYDPATAAGVTGGELVTNGGFDSNLNGWTTGTDAAQVIATWDAGRAKLTRGAGSTGGGLTQTISTTVGKRYRLTFTSDIGVAFRVDSGVVGNVVATSGAYTYDFVATATTAAPYFWNVSTNSVVYLDNIGLQELTYSARGLLIEESRQNLLLQSRDMTQAAWTKTDVTPARTQVGIDGVANTACLMTEGSAGTAVSFQIGAAVTAGSTITASYVVKYGNNAWIDIEARDNTGANGGRCYFNIQTGTLGTPANIGTGTGTTGSITSLGGGWYRCQVTSIPSGSYTAGMISINSATANGNGARVSGATYIVDCAQLEVGAFATSIIPTTTTALTRAADSASMTGTNFSSWFNASAGTFVAEFDTQSVTTQTFGVVGNNAGNARFIYKTTGQSDARSYDGTTIFQTANTLTAVNKVASTYTAGSERALCLNGSTVATTATCAAAYTAGTNLAIGDVGVGNANYLNGHIRSLRFYPSRLSNAQLQALTA